MFNQRKTRSDLLVDVQFYQGRHEEVKHFKMAMVILLSQKQGRRVPPAKQPATQQGSSTDMCPADCCIQNANYAVMFVRGTCFLYCLVLLMYAFFFL